MNNKAEDTLVQCKYAKCTNYQPGATPALPQVNISESHSTFIKGWDDFEKVAKDWFNYVIISSLCKTSVTDAALCCQDPVFGNDGFIPQLLRQRSAIDLFPELPPLKVSSPQVMEP